MATISLYSPKGGVSKTTGAILLGAELALAHRYRVAVLDADANQHASAFAAKADIAGFSVTPDINEGNVLAALRQAEANSDVVFVDLPGMTSTLNLKALQRSHFVVIPCQKSLLDVRDAFKGMAQIEDAEELARAPIARALLWSRVGATIESRADRHVREQVEGKGVPLFATSLEERKDFREIHLTGRVPRQVDAGSKATANVASIAEELLARLSALAEAAA